MNIKMRKFLGGLSRVVSPGYSSCGRCGITWKFVHGHSTLYTESRGCFPLCEHCWESLSIEERLPYYRDLVIDRWGSPEKWEKVRDAVLEGK